MAKELRDIHSFGCPEQVRVRHLDLDLAVDFKKKVLRGFADLTLVRTDPDAPLVLDTRDLLIEKIDGARFELGHRDPILGSPLTIHLSAGTTKIRIHYTTSPGASGLQWLIPEQTAGKIHPFLFTQSQAIHARSWIPLQDSPGVRITYRARIQTPEELTALMSARREPAQVDRGGAPAGDHTFEMPLAIPPYLMALAVGDLHYREMSSRTGVWAELSEVRRAANEFADTERMLQTAERLFGPYAWLRYDILVLPPSFPFGGMENPMLTFATPTVIAGDKSLVSLVAHELAHSWSGNLVTNATWSDFWLNEGFTVYVERRIQEAVFGETRARMEAVLGRQELEAEMANLAPVDQILHIDLKERDPGDGMTSVPYEKGVLFLLALEQAVGRERFDVFLTSYFATFRFQSITTADFLAFLEQNLPTDVPVEEWITKPGIPAGAPRVNSDAFVEVEALAKEASPAKAKTAKWVTQQWLHFLRVLPAPDMAQLDRTFGFTNSGNSEILHQWLLMSVRNGYHRADVKLEEFLLGVGRLKFLKPIYEELVKTPEGGMRAGAIFAKARAGYHPIAARSVEEILRKADAQRVLIH